ncbi:MAG: hypothetical protein ACRBCK_12455 [Alphaproteobacteria bacterium]
MRTVLIFLFYLTMVWPAFAQPPSSPPVVAKVLGISDQNAVLVERSDKPGIKINIKIRGYQIPHRNGSCSFERDLGQQVTKAIQHIVGGKDVRLLNPVPSYDPRVAEAEIIYHDGISIGDYLFLELGLVQPVSNITNIAWCGEEY